MVAFWFGVIAVLWVGFFVLEGFDFGVGVLLPFVARTEAERDDALRTIGPVWDGNEVWLLVAGGATFAAFPEWYASVFSGFYLAFVLLLAGLIVRGIGIEYRGKAATATGRRWCEAGVVVGSLLPAVLLGVAFANFVRGVELNAAHDMTGGFWSLLSPYALLGGVTSLALFALHGALFLRLRTHPGSLHDAARRAATLLLPAAGVVTAGFLVWTSIERISPVSGVLAGAMVIALVAVAAYRTRPGVAFTLSTVVVGLLPVTAFAAMWPDVLPARNGDALSLTAQQAASSHHTLVVMTVVALVMTPVVLAYQAWTYWVFRARVGVPAAAAGDHPLRDRARDAARHGLGPS
ncbi:cytochrome d ubiquinol oxidase subunit II [Jatrophihabitans fulvus]